MEKIKVIYNPVITPELFARAEEPLDHPWFRPGEPPVVLGVGRLTQAKDFPTLIRAFALVRKERPARLMILGEGEERPKLEALVRELRLEEDVALPGFVDNPYKYMKRAAVFVLSSRWEGFGIVLVEAMALGTPVVATDCPSGPAEILENGKWGRLVPPGDPEALAKAILDTLEGGVSRVKATTNVQKRFSMIAIVEQYLKVLGVS
jgi:glycosyltransferase involved in cell wall biosynthesis